MKREDRAASGSDLDQLERRFDRVRSGRSTELDLCLSGKIIRQCGEQFLDKRVLGRSRQVQRVQRLLAGKMVLDRPDGHGMIVAQGQRSCSRQAIDELTAILIDDPNSLGLLDCNRDTNARSTRRTFVDPNSTGLSCVRAAKS
jgi:hypothetical protein